MITIILPWPSKELNPNSRCHWAVKAEAAKLARAMGFFRALERGENGIAGDLEAHYIFHPPDRIRRDIDNCLSSNKSAQDGICEALGVDDSQIKRTVLEWGALVKGGSVDLRIGAITKTVDSGNSDESY